MQENPFLLVPDFSFSFSQHDIPKEISSEVGNGEEALVSQQFDALGEGTNTYP